MRPIILCFTFGLLAGLATVGIGAHYPAVLAAGTGPIFVGVVILSLMVVGTRPKENRRTLRYALFVAICLSSYAGSLIAFSIGMGYSPGLLKLTPSADVIDFRSDVWIGLVLALAIASLGAEFGARVLSGYWSNRILLSFFVAGVLCAFLAYAFSLAARGYWSLFGTLVPLLEGAFAALLCHQLLAAHKVSQGSTE
jgi:hypothetical protein